MAVSQALKDELRKSSELDRKISESFAMIMINRKFTEQNERSQTSYVPAIATNREAVQA